MWKIQKIIKTGDYLYALVPEHPNATKNGYVLLHRVIVENHLGRLLNSNEVVHHKDGNKRNNSIENLEILSPGEHTRLHGLQYGQSYVKLKCPICGTEFELPKNKSFLVKHNKYNCNCCSHHCSGIFSREIQLHGLTPTLKSAISENLLAEYKKYSEVADDKMTSENNTDEDNSEETAI